MILSRRTLELERRTAQLRRALLGQEPPWVGPEEEGERAVAFPVVAGRKIEGGVELNPVRTLVADEFGLHAGEPRRGIG